MMLHCLFLFSCMSVAFSYVKRDWNQEIEEQCHHQNQMARLEKGTTKKIGNGYFDGIYFRNANLVGLDSLWRTGDCSMIEREYCKTRDVHYGLRLAVIDFPMLRIDGNTMSGYIRFVNNSIHYRTTICQDPCQVIVELLELEDVGTIVSGASRPEYDRSDVSGYILRYVLPYLRNYFKSSRIQLQFDMNKALCFKKTNSTLLDFNFNFNY